MAVGDIFYDTIRMSFFIQRDSTGDERILLLSRGIPEKYINKIFGVDKTVRPNTGIFWTQFDAQTDLEEVIDSALHDGT